MRDSVSATCDDAPVMFKPQIEGFLVSTTLFLRAELLEIKHELHSVRGNRYFCNLWPLEGALSLTFPVYIRTYGTTVLQS